jgi:N-acetylated-alpha-linked acidic dipeptidase
LAARLAAAFGGHGAPTILALITAAAWMAAGATAGAAPAATGTAPANEDSKPAAADSRPVSDAAPGPQPRLGFLAPHRDAEARAETAFLAVPAPERARAWLRALTEEPHVAGTPQDKETADYVLARLQEFGLKAELVQYEVLLNYPKSVSLKLTRPEAVSLSLREEGQARDKDSWSDVAFPAFHGYGASGKAAGQVIYVNYGTREDFERLDAMGLSVKGRIALVRYGKVFRGLKVKEAQTRGARAVIIYSDPADDGYMKGDIYPDGPMRPASALQRGSVQFLSSGPGDPTTPGYASKKGVKRVAYEALTGVPKIPSLPLSWGEASKILKALSGPRVPDDWQGGLPFAYHVGPGGAEVEMDVVMDYALRPLWNVIATIPGAVEPERAVILGNHRDAWTYGAVDPNSGTASLLETARGLGAALQTGWKPRRTIMLASWDGEEYGLLGSTEWVEDRLAWLQASAVAYVNLDVAVTGGDLDVSGVPSLRDLLIEVTADLPEPRHVGTVLDDWRGRKQRDWAKSEPVFPDPATQRFELQLDALGSGSDYTAFLDHAGIASVDFTFEGSYGVYHAIYDDLFWMEQFGDPEFLYHTAAARLYGLLAMRLASADIVPLRYAAYGNALQRELELLRRDAVHDRRIWEAVQAAPLASVEPGSQASVEARRKPALSPDFAPLAAAIGELAAQGADLDEALARLEQEGRDLPAGDLARLNDAVVRVERAFLAEAGLPGRPWFRHMLYAPGLTTGYASWPFPGVVQALRERDADALQAQMRVVIERVKDGAAKIAAARALAEGIAR